MLASSQLSNLKKFNLDFYLQISIIFLCQIILLIAFADIYLHLTGYFH